jgi:glutamine amidotransferase
MKSINCIIVDYDVGNIFSIRQAVEALGYRVEVTRDPKAISNASHVILPGVGAFSHAKSKLDDHGLSEVVREYSLNGGNLLGICVGMQLLFSESYEYGEHKGLGLIPGKVDAIKKRINHARVPLIGWQELMPSADTSVFDHIELPNFYFVHSYECLPEDPLCITSFVAAYGNKICASVKDRNTIGVQFHPEKSGESGLRFLHNFLK